MLNRLFRRPAAPNEPRISRAERRAAAAVWVGHVHPGSAGDTWGPLLAYVQAAGHGATAWGPKLFARLALAGQAGPPDRSLLRTLFPMDLALSTALRDLSTEALHLLVRTSLLAREERGTASDAEVPAEWSRLAGLLVGRGRSAQERLEALAAYGEATSLKDPGVPRWLETLAWVLGRQRPPLSALRQLSAADGPQAQALRQALQVDAEKRWGRRRHRVEQKCQDLGRTLLGPSRERGLGEAEERLELPDLPGVTLCRVQDRREPLLLVDGQVYAIENLPKAHLLRLQKALGRAARRKAQAESQATSVGLQALDRAFGLSG